MSGDAAEYCNGRSESSSETISNDSILHFSLKIDNALALTAYSILTIGLDVGAIILLFSQEVLSVAALPATAGMSVVAAVAFLEAFALAGVKLSSDIASTIKNISDYQSTGTATIEVDLVPKSGNIEDIFEWLVL